MNRRLHNLAPFIRPICLTLATSSDSMVRKIKPWLVLPVWPSQTSATRLDPTHGVLPVKRAIVGNRASNVTVLPSLRPVLRCAQGRWSPGQLRTCPIRQSSVSVRFTFFALNQNCTQNQ